MNPMKYYVDADGNYLGGWDANPPEGAVEVPFPPEDARQKWVDGEWLPHAVALPPVALQQVAGARLMVDQDAWDVTGVERSTGISGAMLVDVDTVFVLFSEPQPDTLYEIVPATGVTKYTEYVEVTRPGLTELNFIMQRVQ